MTLVEAIQRRLSVAQTLVFDASTAEAMAVEAEKLDLADLAAIVRKDFARGLISSRSFALALCLSLRPE